MNNKHLVIVSAKTCSACNNYYNKYHNEVIERMKKENVTVHEIKYSDMSDKAQWTLSDLNDVQGKNVKNALEHCRSWFPMFIFLNSEQWTNALKGIKVNEPQVMNGSFKDGKLTYSSGSYQFTADGISSWIKSIENVKSSNEVKVQSLYSSPSIPSTPSTIKTEFVPTPKAKETGAIYTCSHRYIPASKK